MSQVINGTNSALEVSSINGLGKGVHAMSYENADSRRGRGQRNKSEQDDRGNTFEEATPGNTRKAAPVDDLEDSQAAYLEDEAGFPRAEPVPEEGLVLKVSASLYRKLSSTAQKEGVKLNELAVELLSEGIILRAWEIIERKSHIRDNSQRAGNAPQGQGGNNRYNNQHQGNFRGGQQGQGKGGGGRNNNFRRMNQNRYNAIMEDEKQFIEYVRNQERKQR